MWTEYGDDGLVVLTVLTTDADGNVPTGSDCRGWAQAYGSSHPVLADDAGFSHAVMGGKYGYPLYMLVDRGMVVNTLAEGEGSITEEDIVSLL
ncbi:hypothetical protein LBMAG42_53960 [Deltaproteobacteria bacterium]|nr:hypothetical protein LBMAG42_53960 [Deltaproteobacteria bacterium]